MMRSIRKGEFILKKSLCLLIILTLLLPLTTCLASTENTCEAHEYCDLITPKYRKGELVEYTNAGHIYRGEKLQVCVMCGKAERWVPTSLEEKSYVESHVFSVLLRDLGHTVGNTHRYVRGCSDDNCPYTATFDVYCDDSCVSWINRIHLVEIFQ